MLVSDAEAGGSLLCSREEPVHVSGFSFLDSYWYPTSPAFGLPGSSFSINHPHNRLFFPLASEDPTQHGFGLFPCSRLAMGEDRLSWLSFL